MKNTTKRSHLHSMFAKMIILTSVAIIFLFAMSYYVLYYSLRQLQADITASRLSSDIRYVRDLIGDGDWRREGTSLYLGDILVGDGDPEHANLAPFLEGEEKTGTFSYTFVLVSDNGLTWSGDKETGYQEGHYLRTAGSTLGPNGESIVGTYMDKLVADVLDEQGIYKGWANVAGRQIYCIYETLNDRKGDIVGAIVVGRGIEELNRQLSDSTNKFIIIFLLAAVLILVAVVIIVSRWTVSISRINLYLEKLSRGKIPERPLDIQTNDEISDISIKINELANSLREKEILSQYRENIQKASLFNLIVNITKNKIINGEDILIDNTASSRINFKDTANWFVDTMVHTDDQRLLLSAFESEHIDEIMESDPEFTVAVRTSPEVLLSNFRIQDARQFKKEHEGRTWIWIEFHGVYIKDPNDEILLYMDMTDVHDKIHAYEEERIKAKLDPLTKLLNRDAFKEAVEEFMSESGTRGTLFILDLDHFKDINDNFGHPVGDKVLMQMAANLRKIFRSNDLLCRLGGDEFCAFTKGFTDRELLEKRAKAILDISHSEHRKPDDSMVEVSTSVGIAIYPDDHYAYEGLYDMADSALYEAKEAGRNCYRFHNKNK